ncbi:hypothetical protein P7C70_g3898, partial [Phenoliferia sp. Uapishka_3]
MSTSLPKEAEAHKYEVLLKPGHLAGIPNAYGRYLELIRAPPHAFLLPQGQSLSDPSVSTWQRSSPLHSAQSSGSLRSTPELQATMFTNEEYTDQEVAIDEKHAVDFADDNKGIDTSEIREAASHLTLEDAKKIIHDAIDGRQTDPNFDQGLLKRANAALNAEALSHDVALGLVEEIKLEAALMDDSPYVEVRSAVSNTDDWELPVNTFRAWSIGLVFTMIGSGVNVFFSARNPGITLNTFWAFHTDTNPIVYTATLVHIILYYRPEVLAGFRAVYQRKNARDAYNDVHNRLMRRYKEVPEWWFGIVLVISLIFGIGEWQNLYLRDLSLTSPLISPAKVANEVYHTQMPVWGIFFCVSMGAIFVVPVGIIVAITNIEITLNVIAEVIGGYALPGRPLAVMIFKTYGFISTAQAVGYAGDNVKIPPRTLFSAQLIASILASFAGLGVANWQIVNIEGICGANQVSNFTCPGYNTFFNSAVQWGAIGPARLYSQGKIYWPLTFGFLFGAIFPIPVYLCARRWPNSYWKYVNTPAFLYGSLNWAPYNLSYLTPSIPVAIFFQGYLRQRKLAWWTKYNYILSSALTASVSIFG